MSIAQWGYDEFGSDPIISLSPDARGFQVIFNDQPLGVRLPAFTPVDVDPLA